MQRPLMQRVGRSIRHKGPAAHNRHPQGTARTAAANLLQQGAERPGVILRGILHIGQAEQMINIRIQNFIGKSAGVVRLHGPDALRRNLRAKSFFQGWRKRSALPAKQHDLCVPGAQRGKVCIFPAQRVQLRPWPFVRNLPQNHEHQSEKFHQHPTSGIRHHAISRDHARLAVGNACKRIHLRRKGAVQARRFACRRHKAVHIVQGKTGGNIHHGRMPAEGVKIAPVGLGQAKPGQQGVAVLREPEPLAALPAAAHIELRPVVRPILPRCVRHGLRFRLAQIFAQRFHIQRRGLGGRRGHRGQPRTCGYAPVFGAPCAGLAVVQLHGQRVALLSRQQRHAAAGGTDRRLAPAQIVNAQRGSPADPTQAIQQAHTDQQGRAVNTVLCGGPEIRPVHGKGKDLARRGNHRCRQKFCRKAGPQRCPCKRGRRQVQPVHGLVRRPHEVCPGKVRGGGSLGFGPTGKKRAAHRLRSALRGVRLTSCRLTGCRLSASTGHRHGSQPGFELLKQLLPRAGNGNGPHGQRVAPGHQRGGNGVQGPVAVARNRRSRRLDVVMQRGLIRGGEHHALPAAVVLRQRPGLMLGHDDMRVHAAEAKRADPATPGALQLWQRFKLLGYAHRSCLKIDMRVRPLKMRLGRHKAVFDAQHGLGEACSASGGVQVPQIALDRTNERFLPPRRSLPGKSPAQALNFHRVAQHGCRAVGLKKLYVGQRDARILRRSRYDLGLRLRVGGSHAGGFAVLIDGAAGDKRVDGVVVAQGRIQRLEQKHRRALARAHAFRACVKGSGAARGRLNGKGRIGLDGQVNDVRAAHQSQRALAFAQAAAGLVQRRQHRRAGGIHAGRRAMPVFHVAQPGQHVGGHVDKVRLLRQIGKGSGHCRLEKTYRACPRKNAHIGVFKGAAAVACVVQRAQGCFKKHALGRIQQTCVVGRKPKPPVVER